MTNEKELFLSKSQIQFVTSGNDYTLFCGGLGSGKTYAGAVWAMMQVLNYPGVSGIITANSYSQLKKATLVTFFKVLQEYGIDYKYKSQDGEIHIGDTVIYAISMEKYDLLRGIEVGWAWSDECAFYRREAFDVLCGRIRDNKGPCVWKGTTTPNGFNWLYDAFVQDPLDNSLVVYAKTTENAENLSASYIKNLTGQYDSKLAQQELEGQFVNMSSGKVYYAFDRKKNLGQCSDRNFAVLCGLDFNVHPLCGVFVYENRGKIYVSNELYQTDSNTFKAAKEIVRRYPYQRLRVVADDSGTKRKTSSTSTDYEILRRANLEVVNFRNPLVKDRQNNLNRLLDHGLLVIDPKCKKLIEDLEKLTYDNKDDMLSHITDALGYVCWYLDPLKKPKREASVTYN